MLLFLKYLTLLKPILTLIPCSCSLLAPVNNGGPSEEILHMGIAGGFTEVVREGVVNGYYHDKEGCFIQMSTCY